jgi:iron complex transport system permease protein
VTSLRLRPPVAWPRLLFAALLLIAALVWDLSSGSATLSLHHWFELLGGHLPSDPALAHILLDFRVPRVLTALAAGAVLPVAGALMQALFRNPLASPSELGVSAGASLGVALWILGSQSVFWSPWIQPWMGAWGTVGAASLGALAIMLLVMVLAARVQQSATLLIAGLLLSQLIGACIGLLQWMSGAESLRLFTFWGMGSLAGVDPERLRILLPVSLIGLMATLFLAKPLDALALGEETALALGVRLRPFRFALLLAASLLTAVVTAFCGPIAFLALMVPHLARSLMRRTAHSVVLPASMVLGATLLLCCDALTQMPARGGVLPINALTALIGAPVILFVVLRKDRR